MPHLLHAAVLLLFCWAAALPAQTLSESFNNVSGGCVAGWTCTNNSSPLGTTGWFQGDSTAFPAQAGAANAYIAANFNNVAGTNTISNWLISPQVVFANGSQLRLWTRTVNAPQFADRLEIRLSTAGASTNVGATANSTGDFSTLLATINPALLNGAGVCPPAAGAYPNAWCEIVLGNAQGIPVSGNGRIALRYFVTNGGPTGSNSDYIGIDSFSYTQGGGSGPPGGTWIALGPAPAHSGQVEGISNRPVSGAVNALAPHPSNADILYIAAVNGGIWRSDNATSELPTWTRQTDAAISQSVRALTFDPTDGSRQTLVAGFGRLSSFAGIGGSQSGLLRTTNGGSSWTLLDGGGTLNGRNVRAVEARGATIVAATELGIYRSTDTGASFAQVSGGAGTGLPAGNTSDMVRDPSINDRLYAAVVSGTAPGLYRSINGGANWSKVSDATVDASFTGNPRVRIAVGAVNQVFLAVVSNGALAQVFRSSNGATNWVALGVPTTAEQNGVQFGIHVGGQGNLHLSIAADTSNSNIVYVGGDRQPFFGEGVPGSNQFWPNSLGAMDFTGRLFRGDAAQPPATRWASLTHSGTANNSSPHADSRAMAFDAAGNLLEGDDGGVYKRTDPRLNSGVWVSLNRSLQITEYHGIAYDGLANRVIGGAQDTGTSQQQTAFSTIFTSVSTADGGDTAVDDISSVNQSSRYSSFQFLGNFRRSSYNTSDTLLSTTFPALTAIGGSPAMQAQFYTPLAVNRVNGLRLLFGANNGVYESTDQGSTVNRISTIVVNANLGDPLLYGVPGNPDFVYAAQGNGVFLRTTAGGALNLVNTLGAAGTAIRALAVDLAQAGRLFALNQTTVFLSTNSGLNYAPVTGNLATLAPGDLRSMVHVSRAAGDLLLVGADRGVYYALGPSFNAWERLGTGLPNTLVYELVYHAGRDVLIAGTLGRGAWRLDGLSNVASGERIFCTGFEDSACAALP